MPSNPGDCFEFETCDPEDAERFGSWHQIEFVGGPCDGMKLEFSSDNEHTPQRVVLDEFEYRLEGSEGWYQYVAAGNSR